MTNENPVYGRYMFQPKGFTFFQHAFSGALNTPQGHTDQIKNLNRLDKGTLIWKWQEIHVDDFDHPKNRAEKDIADDHEHCPSCRAEGGSHE